jgi:hypothetical protein
MLLSIGQSLETVDNCISAAYYPKNVCIQKYLKNCRLTSRKLSLLDFMGVKSGLLSKGRKHIERV